MSPTSASAVRVRLFALYAEQLGRDELRVEVALPATVAEIVAHIKATEQGAERLPDVPLAAVNMEHVRGDHVVHPGDELSLMPPLAGG